MPDSDSQLVVAHFSTGELPLAFVFSVPGAREKLVNALVAGATGENLSFALEHLHRVRPDIFMSSERYSYRIANAYSRPMANSLGDKSSQATDSQILSPPNVTRFLQEVEDCRIIILCGKKAQLLFYVIDSTEKKVVCTWHTSNRALAGKYNFPEVRLESDSLMRRKLRAKFWAQDLLRLLQ